MSNIEANIAAVQARVATAAQRAGRDPGAVTLVAVTKNRSVAEVEQAISAGLVDLGENRVQEALPKVAALAGRAPAPTWHLIGHLQTNKVRDAIGFAHLIHSLDRPRLAEALERRAALLGQPVRALLQVNLTGEGTKGGFALAEVEPFLRGLSAYPHLQIEGLMTMAALSADPEESRPVFRQLRGLSETLAGLRLPGVTMRHLSMGMSGDFEVAVEEGATLIRVGTALFGPR